MALRQAGRSKSQIAAALGLRGGGGRLHQWLRGVPPPEWTARPNAKDDLREEAIALRRGGLSYREIRDQLPVSKSTLSLWLRDVPLTEEQRHAQGERAVGASASRAEANRALRARRRANTEADARAQVSDLAESGSSSPASWPTGPRAPRTSPGGPARESSS